MAKTVRFETFTQVSCVTAKRKARTSPAKSRTSPAPAGEYSVGDGPRQNRGWFRPGQSGNLQGRPKKGSKTREAPAQETLEQKIEINEAGRRRKRSVRQIAFQRIGEKAASGDLKSANFLLTKETEERQLGAGAGQSSVPLETALEIIRRYLERQQAAKEKDNDDQA